MSSFHSLCAGLGDRREIAARITAACGAGVMQQAAGFVQDGGLADADRGRQQENRSHDYSSLASREAANRSRVSRSNSDRGRPGAKLSASQKGFGSSPVTSR